MVLDCDTANEVDDQFAIAHALGLPPGTLDVRGVVSVHNTTAHGPASRDMYQDEAERVVALCGAGGAGGAGGVPCVVPCVPGADRPMEAPDGPVYSAGLDFLVEEARRGPLTVVATGPATDAASLLLAAPEVARNVRVVWLGGFADEAHYRRFKMSELNGRADVAAWRALLAGPVDLLQVPGWPAAAKLVVETAPFARRLRALGRPVAEYLAGILEAWASEYEGAEDAPGEKILWDPACVAAIADPDAVTVERLAVPSLDAAGAHDFSARGREVETVTDLDPGRVLAGLTEALGRHPAGRGL